MTEYRISIGAIDVEDESEDGAIKHALRLLAGSMTPPSPPSTPGAGLVATRE